MRSRLIFEDFVAICDAKYRVVKRNNQVFIILLFLLEFFVIPLFQKKELIIPLKKITYSG